MNPVGSIHTTQVLRVNYNGHFTELFSSHLGPHPDSVLERRLAKRNPERPELTEISNLTVLAKILSSDELYTSIETLRPG
jgi:hypothetical protein